MFATTRSGSGPLLPSWRRCGLGAGLLALAIGAGSPFVAAGQDADNDIYRDYAQANYYAADDEPYDWYSPSEWFARDYDYDYDYDYWEDEYYAEYYDGYNRDTYYHDDYYFGDDYDDMDDAYDEWDRRPPSRRPVVNRPYAPAYNPPYDYYTDNWYDSDAFDTWYERD